MSQLNSNERTSFSVDLFRQIKCALSLRLKKLNLPDSEIEQISHAILADLAVNNHLLDTEEAILAGRFNEQNSSSLHEDMEYL